MFRKHSEPLTAVCLILISATIGLMVHPFYDWTGADQSRPVALLWQVPLAISVLLLLFIVALPWIPIQREVERVRRPVQFGLRFLLATTGVVAGLLAMGSRFPLAVSGITLLFTVLMVVYCAWRNPVGRWSLGALLAAMYFPYYWVIVHEFRHVNLSLSAGVPAFLPSMLLSSLLPQHPADAVLAAIAVVLVSLEIGVGLALLQCGPKRGFAYISLVLIVSLFGAVGLDAAMRI